MASKHAFRISVELRLAYRDLLAILTEKHPNKSRLCRAIVRFVDEYQRDSRRRKNLIGRASYVENHCCSGSPFHQLGQTAFAAYRRWEKSPIRAINKRHRADVQRALQEAQQEAKDTNTPLTSEEAKGVLAELRRRKAGDLEWARNTLSEQFEILKNSVKIGLRWDNEIDSAIAAIDRAIECRAKIDPEDSRGTDLQTALDEWKSKCKKILKVSYRLKANGCYFLYHVWQASEPAPSGWATSAEIMLKTVSGYVHYQPMRDAAQVLMSRTAKPLNTSKQALVESTGTAPLARKRNKPLVMRPSDEEVNLVREIVVPNPTMSTRSIQVQVKERRHGIGIGNEKLTAILDILRAYGDYKVPAQPGKRRSKKR